MFLLKCCEDFSGHAETGVASDDFKVLRCVSTGMPLAMVYPQSKRFKTMGQISSAILRLAR